MSSATRPDVTRPWHICDALDDERAAYVYLREVLPDLAKPASDRRPLDERQREAMLLWQAAEQYANAIAGYHSVVAGASSSVFFR